MSIEHSIGDMAPSVLVETADSFIVDIDGGEAHHMTRARLGMLAEAIYRALNTSQDEIDAAADA